MPDRAVETRAGLRAVLGDLRPEERAPLFDLFAAVVEAREGFPEQPPLTDDGFDAAWGPPRAVVVARVEQQVVGGARRGGGRGRLRLLAATALWAVFLLDPD